MKSIPIFLPVAILCLVFACGNSSGNTNAGSKETTTTGAGNSQQAGNELVGEWQQQFTCFDKNGNYKLEPEEKTPSGTKLGFDWFRFNADGSCLRDRDVQFKGTYSIQEKNGKKKLIIEGGDNIRYTIVELTPDELILGSDGAFIIFKRIK